MCFYGLTFLLETGGPSVGSGREDKDCWLQGTRRRVTLKKANIFLGAYWLRSFQQRCVQCCWTRGWLIFTCFSTRKPCLSEQKKSMQTNFSIPYAKQCIQITCFHDCHSVTLVIVEMVFASLEIMLLIADFIAWRRCCSLKCSFPTKYFDLSTTKQNNISLLTLMELGRNLRISLLVPSVL